MQMTRKEGRHIFWYSIKDYALYNGYTLIDRYHRWEWAYQEWSSKGSPSGWSILDEKTQARITLIGLN
jgi:hypothetical protein